MMTRIDITVNNWITGSDCDVDFGLYEPVGDRRDEGYLVTHGQFDRVTDPYLIHHRRWREIRRRRGWLCRSKARCTSVNLAELINE